ncbi:flagellar basal body-associated FliL family protein [Sulfitobacter mediterraneus]|uniref:flagellar basal body-associated FliL family protein n=1 Tax=Sulfitobacter mediterraneus TaxID=83219 RepID=UPI0021A4FDD8|nr:flagellar basal body-associated FliL family protein [Sulfitobacter mediterraneus]UWR13558.1 flagellar basal body-associated FliL family protein [Sulfitobacter mediterraneus]
MAGKAKENRKPEEAAEGDAPEAKPKGSKKMLVAAMLFCMVSLGAGFFLARMAYMQDAEAYEPEYKDEDEALGEDMEDGKEGKDDHAEKGNGITDPLAKDGHEAEKAEALKAKDEGGHGEATHDSGLLDFGEMLTNIEGYDVNGAPTRAFLKVNLVVAYRPEEGASEVMEERQAFMRDLFNSYLRGLTEADVRGMAGLLFVKSELLKRARAAAGSDLPQEILIKDLIVQ